NSDPSIFPSIIKQNVKNQVLCTVFSSKTNEYRVVTLVPDWWAEEKDGLLGCSIRYCDYNGAAMHVWHVVDITKGSPAEMAGLQVDLDYILGSPDAILRDQQDLYSLITQKCEEKKAVKLFVYNSSSESIREVILLPNKEWGNGNVAGMIGAEL
ncbi:Golgi reassembly-stacking protein 2, partial [Coelomomyces lativittatus]